MSLGRRIASARQRKAWSQAKLGAAVGKSAGTIWSWESGRTEPTREDVVRVAIALETSVEEIEGVGAFSAQPVARSIPLISWVSAGGMVDLQGMDEIRSDDQVVVGELPPGEYFATTVKGDSMDRISPPGSIIVVNSSDKRLSSGFPYVFSSNGEATYKIYQAEPVRRLEPFSTNPNNKTIFLGESDWTVIGRVYRSIVDLI